ncbi:MAG: 4Fe-4S binding protein [Thermoplasmatota archaeon]
MKKVFKHGDVVIKISYNMCTGSGECVQACPMDIIELVEGKAVITDIKKCIECCACFNACPNSAIDHSSCP